MKPWMFTSERQPTHDRTPNLERSWDARRNRRAQRRQRIRAMARNLRASLGRPATVPEFVKALTGEDYTGGKAKVRFLDLWGHERGAWSVSRVYAALGWPPLKNGRPLGRKDATPRQREETLHRRSLVEDALRGETPMGASDVWWVLSRDRLPSRAANQKLYSYWGRLKEEPANGRGKRIAAALGWPEPKRGRPKRGQP